jgi:sulfide:quinone oxidoreductase
VEIVTPEKAFRYRPFAVAEAFEAGPGYSLELTRVASDAGARLTRGRVVAVDRARKVVFTATDHPLAYDLLVVACGARPDEGLPGALTFRGEQDEAAVRQLLSQLEHGPPMDVAFAIPPGPTWALPLYELALMTAARLERRGRRASRLRLVTPEAQPLGVFGAAASTAIRDLLAAAGIELRCRRYADRLVDGRLLLVPREYLPVDRVVTLPRLHGPNLVGLPRDPEGFVPVDLHGAVLGAVDVYAAGDVTSFALKQGGIAAQQAIAAAEAVAARLGATIRPKPFRPVLRGLLLTGKAPRFLWTDLAGGRGETSTVATFPLWWPPGKIAGGHAARYLHRRGLPVPPPPAGPEPIPVEIRVPDDPAPSEHRGGPGPADPQRPLAARTE